MKRKMGSRDDDGDADIRELANNASRKTSEFDKVKKQKVENVGPQGMVFSCALLLFSLCNTA